MIIFNFCVDCAVQVVW